MNLSLIHVDENGFARGFAHHDGFLDGVVGHGPGGDVQLSIRSAGGERRIIVLAAVSALSVDGFRDGNLILSIQLLRSTEASKLPHVEALLRHRLSRSISAISPDANIFLLEASYGAEVIAICTDALVSEAGASLGPITNTNP